MKVRIPLLVTCVALLSLSVPTDARFLKPELKKVPVETLIKNLQAQLERETTITTNTRFNLARVYAMAYALKVESVDVASRGGDGGKKGGGKGGSGASEPWFGPTPPVVPFKAVATADKDKLEKADMYLKKAIKTYKLIINDQPNHLPARLGLAWCLEQAGDKADAIKAYRDVIELGWDKERKLKAGPLGGNFITKEAASYLIPLLDAKKDADEIDTLKSQSAKLDKLPRPITPIAIPLQDGLTARDLEDRTASVRFDADGSDLDRRWTWIRPNAAWLVHDPHHTGKITSGLQLFGNVTFWCFWDNGYQALRGLDDNQDGNLTGAELASLALWHDANANGICDPGEVRSLSAHGITALSCECQTDPHHPDRIAFSPRGVTFRDGTTRPSFDLILQQR
jgi:tetratricopeptide (TPR) repeat protein